MSRLMVQELLTIEQNLSLKFNKIKICSTFWVKLLIALEINSLSFPNVKIKLILFIFRGFKSKTTHQGGDMLQSLQQIEWSSKTRKWWSSLVEIKRAAEEIGSMGGKLKMRGSLQSSLGRDKRVASEMGSNKRALLRPGFKVKILFQCSSSMKEEGYEKKMETQYQEQAGMSKSRYQEQHWNQPMIMQRW